MIKLNQMTGAEFSRLYAALGYNQTSIARELGYTARSIRRFENDEIKIPRSIMLALREICNVHSFVNAEDKISALPR